ncbi:carbohydrate sulfotransferase 3-like [Saccoglossus kowalevskii]|uniref:Carbohydrate sulfotransferase 3-like n=1 Tax=Saccoglossus kowalevskii TaxID=10224 RepID=A0ABM0GTP4_SACKO|nr:PREDICTED: carbohydrate sulfotransferase 3-like [Saccoglossus kowalevskii]
MSILDPLTGVSDILVNNDVVKENDGLRIVLVAAFRTGSTFTGELLNMNPNIFYLFEPFRIIQDIVKRNAIGKDLENSTKLELLTDIFACRFPTYFVHHIRHWGLATYESNSLKDACMQHKGCKNMTPEELAETCKGYKHVAMKVIRLQSLKLLQPLLVRDSMNLKVLHLIRDPRGVASSRKYMYKNAANKPIMKAVVDTTRNYCQSEVEMLELSSVMPDWLRGRYKLIRYEDNAIGPLKMAKNVYDFLNLKLPPKVTQWINENTKSDVTPMGVMSTRKNSSAAAQSWRFRLLYNDVEVIQNLPPCHKLMEILGYNRITSPIQMYNMSYISF